MSSDAEAVARPPFKDVRVRRLAKRADYERASIDAFIDAALIGHVGSIRDGRPVVVPMLCVRDGDGLILHGSPASGTVRRARDLDVCVTMTVLDGLVLARSAFHHRVGGRPAADDAHRRAHRRPAPSRGRGADRRRQGAGRSGDLSGSTRMSCSSG